MKKALLILLLTAAPASAQEIGRGLDAPLPQARPVVVELETVPLPRKRPDPEGNAETAQAESEGDPERMTGNKAPAETEDQTDRIYQIACPAVLDGTVTATILPPIRDDVCRAQSPLSVTALHLGDGEVELSAPVALNCQMAGALAGWVERVDAYTQAIFGAGVVRILAGTSYMCRPRNNASDADVSEHGFANALDITGFELADGRRISLPDNWDGDDRSARAMRFAHDVACGHFTTVLGPEANALHDDHLHFDLGCHGETCTARICE